MSSVCSLVFFVEENKDINEKFGKRRKKKKV